SSCSVAGVRLPSGGHRLPAEFLMMFDGEKMVVSTTSEEALGIVDVPVVAVVGPREVGDVGRRLVSHPYRFPGHVEADGNARSIVDQIFVPVAPQPADLARRTEGIHETELASP